MNKHQTSILNLSAAITGTCQVCDQTTKLIGRDTEMSGDGVGLCCIDELMLADYHLRKAGLARPGAQPA